MWMLRDFKEQKVNFEERWVISYEAFVSRDEVGVELSIKSVVRGECCCDTEGWLSLSTLELWFSD